MYSAKPAIPLQSVEYPLSETLQSRLTAVAANCTGCGLCVRQCGFLQKHGNPQQQARNYQLRQGGNCADPFACHLCGLCTALCPHQVDPAGLFLALRRAEFRQGRAEHQEYKGLRRYERVGTSQRFSWYALPQDCETIFFPGCSLTGSRPETTWKTFAHLRQALPSIGIVLDCCTKPSHDLGDEDYFSAMFGELKNYLLHQGIKQVLVACPSCQRVFSTYAPELTTRMVYELLNELPLPATPAISASVDIHDPCVARFNSGSQRAVRALLTKKGLQLSEPAQSGKTTLCCGAGGAVSYRSPERSAAWQDKHCQQLQTGHLVSYCASCTQVFAARTRSSHVLDLLFEPELTIAGQAVVSKGLLTYWNRLRLKARIRKNVVAAVTRERTFPGAPKGAPCPTRTKALARLSLRPVTVIVGWTLLPLLYRKLKALRNQPV